MIWVEITIKAHDNIVLMLRIYTNTNAKTTHNPNSLAFAVNRRPARLDTFKRLKFKYTINDDSDSQIQIVFLEVFPHDLKAASLHPFDLHLMLK